MEEHKCEMDFRSDIYCQKHHVKTAASTEIRLKLTPISLRKGWVPKTVAIGDDSNLSVERVSIWGCFPDPQSAPHSYPGVLSLLGQGWL